MELEELRRKIKDNRTVPNNCIDVLHYTKHLKDIVDKDRFILSKFAQSNDKRESYDRLQRREEIDKYRYMSTTSYKRTLENIYSFRNPVLWMYYADKYKGVTFSIDANKIIDDYKDYIVNYGYVEYIRGIHDDLTTGEYLMCKSEEWEYEQEYRIIFGGIDSIEEFSKYINEVYFGCECSDSFKRIIKSKLNGVTFHDTYFDTHDGRINTIIPKDIENVVDQFGLHTNR